MKVLNIAANAGHDTVDVLVNLQNVIDFNKTFVYIRKNESEIITVYISQRKYSSFKKSFFRFIGGNK